MQCVSCTCAVMYYMHVHSAALSAASLGRVVACRPLYMYIVHPCTARRCPCGGRQKQPKPRVQLPGNVSARERAHRGKENKKGPGGQVRRAGDPNLGRSDQQLRVSPPRARKIMRATLIAVALALATGYSPEKAFEANVRTRYIVDTNTTSHYGDPFSGCASDEKTVGITGITGEVCSPPCASGSTACPSDVPSVR